MKLPFTFYMHSSAISPEKADAIVESLTEELPAGVSPFQLPTAEKLQQKVRYVFDEVALKCLYDTESGEITLESAKL